MIKISEFSPTTHLIFWIRRENCPPRLSFHSASLEAPCLSWEPRSTSSACQSVPVLKPRFCTISFAIKLMLISINAKPVLKD